MTNPLTTPADEYRRLLIRTGLGPDDANRWLFLRNRPDALTRQTLTTPMQYRDAGLDTQAAIAWYHLDVTAEEARQYEHRHWAPGDLVRLRRAISDAAPPSRRDRNDSSPPQPRPESRPKHRIEGPTARQPDEIHWLHTCIPPDLVPLYVRAGKTPGAARDIDLRRRNGDTTIKPLITTLAAIRNDPRI